jgi:hypothetical protein
MKYRAECLAGQCADGDVVRTFDTRADRNEWERAHREATGHTMIGYDWREPERRRYPVPPVVLAFVAALLLGLAVWVTEPTGVVAAQTPAAVEVTPVQNCRYYYVTSTSAGYRCTSGIGLYRIALRCIRTTSPTYVTRYGQWLPTSNTSQGGVSLAYCPSGYRRWSYWGETYTYTGTTTPIG